MIMQKSSGVLLAAALAIAFACLHPLTGAAQTHSPKRRPPVSAAKPSAKAHAGGEKALFVRRHPRGGN